MVNVNRSMVVAATALGLGNSLGKNRSVAFMIKNGVPYA